MDAVSDFGWRWTRHAQASGNTLLVRRGPGTLHTVTLTLPGTGTGDVILYDGIDATGNVIMTWTPVNLDAPVTVTFDLRFTTGLYLAGANTADNWECVLTHN